MKKWKTQLLLSVIFTVALASFAVVMHQRIVATSINSSYEDARDNLLGKLCGQIYGLGLAAIWYAPFYRLFRKKQ